MTISSYNGGGCWLWTLENGHFSHTPIMANIGSGIAIRNVVNSIYEITGTPIDLTVNLIPDDPGDCVRNVEPKAIKRLYLAYMCNIPKFGRRALSDVLGELGNSNLICEVYAVPIKTAISNHLGVYAHKDENLRIKIHSSLVGSPGYLEGVLKRFYPNVTIIDD